MADTRKIGLTGIVLAGGQSRRMGRNKALLDLNGRPLISHVLERLETLCDELLISANDPEPYTGLPVRVVPDVILGRGALSGIHAGLAAMRNRWAVVVACDMPFLSLPLLRYMASVAPGHDVVVPRLGEHYEPLHAIYSADCVEPIVQLVAARPRRVVELYRRVRVREITERQVHLFDAGSSFFNVNTLEEWDEVQRLIATRGVRWRRLAISWRRIYNDLDQLLC